MSFIWCVRDVCSSVKLSSSDTVSMPQRSRQNCCPHTRHTMSHDITHVMLDGQRNMNHGHYFVINHMKIYIVLHSNIKVANLTFSYCIGGIIKGSSFVPLVCAFTSHINRNTCTPAYTCNHSIIQSCCSNTMHI